MAAFKAFSVFLNVSNPEKSAAFYEALGFPRAYHIPAMNMFAYRVGNTQFLLGAADQPDAPEATKQWLANKPWGVGALLMPEVEDVEDVYAKAQAYGAEIEEPPTAQPWGSKTLSIVDPDGYSIMFEEVTTPMDPVAAGGSWGPAHETFIAQAQHAVVGVASKAKTFVATAARKAKAATTKATKKTKAATTKRTRKTKAAKGKKGKR